MNATLKGFNVFMGSVMMEAVRMAGKACRGMGAASVGTAHVAGAAYRGVTTVGKWAWKGVKAVGSMIKRHALKIAVATGSTVVAGFATTSMGGAVAAAAGISMVTILAIRALIAKRNKQKLDWKRTINEILDTALIAALAPMVLLHLLAFLAVALDTVWAGAMYSYLYAMILIVV